MKAFTTWMTHTAPSGNRRQLRTEYQVGLLQFHRLRIYYKKFLFSDSQQGYKKPV